MRDLGYLYPMSGMDVESGTAKGHHAIALAIDPNASEPSEHLRAMLEALQTAPSSATVCHSLVLVRVAGSAAAAIRGRRAR